MDLSIISLLFLIACIAVGFIMKRNIGFLAIAMALILGGIGGLDDAAIISGFNVNLFVILLGVSYLFSIAEENRTMELVARKMLGLVKNRIFLLAPLLFLLAALIAMAGPGTIATFALMAPLATALALELNVSPLKLVVFPLFGACGGGMSPIAPTGIIAVNLAAQQGYSGFATANMLTMLFITFLFCLIYYFAARCHKLNDHGDIHIKADESISKPQWITIGGIVCMIALVLLFDFNVGLASFLIAGILNLLKVAEEKHVLSLIPWGTLIMVSGVGVLMNVIIILGGIDRLADSLAAVMTISSAPTLMCLLSGVMGWFASSSGVVMPTLLPTISSVIEQLGGGVEPFSLISAICCGTHLTSISPASTGGALALASYITLSHASVAEQNRYFLSLFGISAAALVFGIVMGALGAFSWLGAVF